MNDPKERHLELIRQLSEAKGASGFEDEVTALAAKWAAPFCDTRETNIRNLYLHPKQNTGTRPVIMLDAHSDEVGMMVQAIHPNGLLSFLQLGGFTPGTLAGQKVWVRNAKGAYIPGVVASKPVHFMDQAQRAAAQPDSALLIDVGAVSAREAVEDFHLRIGEPCVPAVCFQYDAPHDLMLGKAFDCRLGCAALLATMERLSALPAAGMEVVGCLTAQEELGERGVLSAVRSIRPAAAIVFEGAPADDSFAQGEMIQTALRRGPMLRFMDCGMVSNPRFTRFALDLAAQKKILVQQSVRAGGGTNGSAIHVAEDGIPVIVIGIPVRYIHSHHGFSTYQDFSASVELALEIIEALTPDILSGF